MVLSYGPCQFPTLGFIVERFQQVRDFKPEKFWSLQLKVSKQVQGKVEETKFEWDRGRLFDKLCVMVILEKCYDTAKARVNDV